MNHTYITGNPEELFEQAPKPIQEMILGDEVNGITALLGKLYKIPISSYILLENIISYLLIGAIKPEVAVACIKETLGLEEEQAYTLAEELNKTILDKARMRIRTGKETGVVTLTFGDGKTSDELRKEIMDTTKREDPGVLSKRLDYPVPGEAGVKKSTDEQAGTRTRLLEQLQILGNIPDDKEVTERLQKIQDQIKSMTPVDERALESHVALQEFMPKDGGEVIVEPTPQSATYSKAPTKYNVDPYREVAE